MTSKLLVIAATLAIAGASPALARSTPARQAAAPAADAAAMARATEEDAKLMDEMFAKTDLNHNGRISRSEMYRNGVMNNRGTAIREREWRIADSNHNNSLSKQEFVKYALDQRDAQAAAAQAKP